MSGKLSAAEARKQRILEKLNNKYGDSLNEETQPLTQAEKPENHDNIVQNDNIIENKDAIQNNTDVSSAVGQEKAESKPEKTESAFDEYKKLKKYENFRKNYKKIERLVFGLFGIVCSFLILSNSTMSDYLGQIYITLEIINISFQQFYKSKLGTDYFNKSNMTFDFMKNLGALNNLVEIVSKSAKYLELLTDRISNVSIFILILVIFTEIFVYFRMGV